MLGNYDSQQQWDAQVNAGVLQAKQAAVVSVLGNPALAAAIQAKIGTSASGSQTLSTIPYKGYANGTGLAGVPGSGSGDTVPAMLTPGEIVVPQTASNAIRSATGSGDSSSSGSMNPGDIADAFHGQPTQLHPDTIAALGQFMQGGNSGGNNMSPAAIQRMLNDGSVRVNPRMVKAP